MKRILLGISLFAVVLSLAGCTGAEYENILSNNDALLEQQNELASSLEETQNKLDAILDELDSISGELVQTKLDLYLAVRGADEDFSAFFNAKTADLVAADMSSEDIVADFTENYSIAELAAVNDDLSTTSTITIDKPAANEYNVLNVHIYYHGELLETTTLYDNSDDFTIDFEAPNYGKYTAVIEIVYDEVTIEEYFDFGVTSSHYNMAFLNATKPVLMYTADLVTNQTEDPTFIQIVRLSTFNWDMLPENTYEFPEFIPNVGLITEGIDELSDWIYELYSIDKTSTFTLNIVDNYTGIAIVCFDRYQIPEENYNVNIWTDGAFTEYTLNTYTTEQILNDRIAHVQQYRKDALYVNASAIDYDYVNTNVREHALAYAASMENVHYYTDGLDGITVTDQAVLDAIDAKMSVMTIADLFDDLKESGNINEFEYLLNTRWGDNPEDCMSYYFNSEKGKYLLILGTSPAGEASNATNKYYTFDEYLQMVITAYGDEYEIFYKGHPAYPSSTERQTLFANEGIIELEKTIPVEILMYIYPDVYVGGYSGSSFYSSQEGQTIFFYGTEAFVRGRATLADMMDNSTIFDNTVFLYDETK